MATMVHPVARLGFGREAEAYERSRPPYPPDAVAWLLRHLRVRPGAVVADLAAGTGKLTRLLVPGGARVIALEPVRGMHQVMQQLLPAVPLIAGTADAIPLKASSLDAVCVAQAFHWFQADKAFTELARVLRQGGRVGMLWNTRDRSVEWVDQVWAIMDDVEKGAPWREHRNWRESVFGEPPQFGPPQTATFHHEHATTPHGVVERIRGVSHVAALEADEQESVLAEVAELLATHRQTRGRQELRIPYRVDCCYLERE